MEKSNLNNISSEDNVSDIVSTFM